MEEEKTPANQTVVEFEDKKRFNLPAFLVWITFIISSVFLGYLWIGKRGLDTVVVEKTEEKVALTSQVSSTKYAGIEKEAGSVKDAVETLSSIANDKIKTSELLTDIYSYLTSDVVVTSFSVGESGSVSLDGATGSYRQAADFIVAVKSNKRITNVELKTIFISTDAEVSASEKIIFSMTGSLDKSVEEETTIIEE